jgi:hypothetical protein
MSKEELLNLIETLKLTEIKSITIEYYTENNYGPYDNRTTTVLTINGKGE